MEIALLLIMMSFEFTSVPVSGFLGSHNELKPLPPKPGRPFKPLPPLPGLPGVNKKKEISLEMKRMNIIRKMKGVTNVQEFLRRFNPKKGYMKVLRGDKSSFIISHSLGDGQSSGKKLPKVPPQARCEPRLKVRDISHLGANYSGMIWPTCITYPQCGGCCYRKDLHDCVPATFNETTASFFLIDYYDYSFTPKTFKYKVHTSCRCGCRIQKTDCVGHQTYDEDSCMCDCPWSAEIPCPRNKRWSKHFCDCVCNHPAISCDKLKFWNTKTCSCTCKEKRLCLFGMKWDTASCHCVNPTRGR